MKAQIALLAALLTAVSCSSEESVKRPVQQTATTQIQPDLQDSEPAEPAPPPAPKGPELDATPRISFVDNHRRLHQFQDQALVIPVATDGVLKYVREYRRPLGKIAERDGLRARVFRRNVQLDILWTEQESAVQVWVFGKARQRIELKVNGKRAGVQTLGESGWSTLDFPVKAELLSAGANTLGVYSSTSLELQAVAIRPAAESAMEGAPPKVVDKTKRELRGATTYALVTEVPETAWLGLSATSEASAKAKVNVLSNGQRTTLAEFSVDASPGKHVLDLKAFAGKLVRIELEGEDVAWVDPMILLESRETRPQPKPFKNAILVVVDALRSDRLKLYGDTRVETPNFTAEGKARGIVFRKNQSASPSSPPSHGSIQSGQIARVHGVAGDKGDLKPGAVMISAELRKAGFETAYIGNNPFGMRRLKTASNWSEYIEPNRMGKGIDCTAINEETLKFAKAQSAAGKRFFISTLPFEPHTPYRFHEGTTEKYHDGGWGPPVDKLVTGYLLNDLAAGRKVLNEDQWSQLRALYDGEVEHMDTCFGDLVAGLKAAGLSDDTAIILTSDHGEAMFERGKMGHAYGLNGELSNVPFVIFADGFGDGPINVDVPTGVIDIVPTMLDLLGVERSPRIQGQSVVPLALRNGLWTPQVVSGEYGRAFTLRSAHWRYIVNYDGSEELYDLKADPTEQTDLAKTRAFELAYFRENAGLFLEFRSDWRAKKWGPWNNHGPQFGER